MARTQTPNHPQSRVLLASLPGVCCWAEARIKIARMTLTIKLDGNWSSFQLANSAPPLSVTDSAIAPSARMEGKLRDQTDTSTCGHLGGHPTTNSSVLAHVGKYNEARRDPSKLSANARGTCSQHREKGRGAKPTGLKQMKKSVNASLGP